MLKEGLIEEVQSLQKMGYGPELNSLRTVGYQEVFDYLAGRLNQDDMLAQIKIHSRQYAKRQLTWFRRDHRVEWYDLGKITLAEMAKNLHQRISS